MELVNHTTMEARVGPTSTTPPILYPDNNWATFSSCGKYRYTLGRVWDVDRSLVLFVMLNPSTADSYQNDPTVRRCIKWANLWGFGGLLVGNLFALRSPHPTDLYQATDPVGPDNDRSLVRMCQQASKIIVAWGTHGTYKNRSTQVRTLLTGDLYCLRCTANGEPGHPLYLPTRSEPVLWTHR